MVRRRLAHKAGLSLFEESELLILTLLTSFVIYAGDTPDHDPNRLIDLFGCGPLMKPTASAPPVSGFGKSLFVRIKPADSFFDARELERQIANPEGLFRIGWIPADPLNFQYLIRARLFDAVTPNALEVSALRATALARGKRPVGRIQVFLGDGRTLEYTLGAQADALTVLFDDEDVERALLNANARTERVNFWIWHPNGNPPLPSEIAEVRSLARMRLWSKKPRPKVSLKVAGESWGGIALFETDIPPPEEK